MNTNIFILLAKNILQPLARITSRWGSNVALQGLS